MSTTDPASVAASRGEPAADYAALFEAHLPFLARVLPAVARVLGFRDEVAEEFAAWARVRLWEDDYAVLRRWRGESRLTTYLASVATNLGHEYRDHRWGRWRPSAAARRLGPLAVRLETLVYRDGYAFTAAAAVLRTRDPDTPSDGELARLLAQLPARGPGLRTADDVGLETVAADVAADDPLLAAEDTAERRTLYAALDAALARLPAEERVVVRLHYLHGHTLADVARALGVPQKPLYRLRDRALAALAADLRAAGVTSAQVRSLFGGALDPADGPGMAAAAHEGETVDVHPSHLVSSSANLPPPSVPPAAPLAPLGP